MAHGISVSFTSGNHDMTMRMIISRDPTASMGRRNVASATAVEGSMSPST